MSQHKIVTLQEITPDTPPGQYIVNGKVVTHTGEETKVQQSDKEYTEINHLLEPLLKKGGLRHSIKFEGEYDDVPVQTYRDAQLQIARANTMHSELPPNIRKQFPTPEEFLEFVQNPDNYKEMVKLGIAKGNDGKTKTGANSGAPTKEDQDGDGKKDVANPPETP